MSIKDRIKQRLIEIESEIQENVREAAYTLHGEIQVRTPVDTGNARRDWVIAPHDGGFMISNLEPYIHVLEYGLFPNPPFAGTGKTINGFSTQAPKGFVRLSINDIAKEYRLKWK